MIQTLYSARNRTSFLYFAPALFLAVILAVPAAAAVISNGDFEAVPIGSPFFSNNASDVPGWIHEGDDGGGFLWGIGFSDLGGSVTVAGSGNQFVTLGGGFDHVGTSSWSTSISSLVPGQSYLLDFMLADENTFTSIPQEITVDFTAGSATLPATFAATLLPVHNYWRTWQNQETAFVATGSNATVRFTSTTRFDVGLDNVRVTEAVVPEPRLIALLICGSLVMLVKRGSHWPAAGTRRVRAPDPAA